MPEARASSMTVGEMKCTWVSMAPAVTIFPLPAMISVSGPITRAGSTPSIVSGLPALPMPQMRPSRMPMSALTMPQWSMTTTPVITVSGAPSARVVRACPMDSRITLPPPNTASSPERPGPPLRSSSISTNRSVSASRMRSPAVGPKRSAYARRSSSAIERPPVSPRRPGTVRSPANGTSSTATGMPGSKRTAVPAAMLSRSPRAAARSKSRPGLASAKW